MNSKENPSEEKRSLFRQKLKQELSKQYSVEVSWLSEEVLEEVLQQANQELFRDVQVGRDLIIKGDIIQKVIQTIEPTMNYSTFESQMKKWFVTLGYNFENYKVIKENSFEWIVNIPVRRGYDRILVRGVNGEADSNDFYAVYRLVEEHKTDEGWIVAPRRISDSTRQKIDHLNRQEVSRKIFAYTFDELVDEEADFSKYFDWLDNQIRKLNIDTDYVSLYCSKEEIQPITNKLLGISHYRDDKNGIDGYIEVWLDDPSKKHISILGQFGTGKTWFSLHYAWTLLQKYKQAKDKGIKRPRLPLYVPLQNYAKAVTIESLFSEFFFRKHQIELRGGYPTFEELNSMGKFLLLFDGFDEMAARVNRQAMINNFWELAKVVVSGSKAILTCRTEHFPKAIEGRAILNAELKASTANLTGEPPQFEVLELEKFNDEQIRQVLSHKTESETIDKIMNNSQLVDLARRPIMIDLIIEALPRIEAERNFDIARVYLYAIRRKMERDITEKRTFTSMLDKLYFLCELAWEMLSTNRLTINFQEFPERIQRLFGREVQEQTNLDHWQYDMTGQTILTRNADGDYTFAHRSFLEFFVAYKVTAELGILSRDFIELSWENSNQDIDLHKDYTWSQYLQYIQNQREENESRNSNLRPISFKREDISILKSNFGQISLSVAEKAILELIDQMSDRGEKTIETLFKVIEITKTIEPEEVGYLGGNAVTLLLKCNNDILSGKDLSNTIIKNADFTVANLSNTNFSSADLTGCAFAQTFGSVFSLVFSPLENLLILGDSTGSIRSFKINDPHNYSEFKGHKGIIRSIAISPDGRIMASASEDGTVRLWDCQNYECLQTLSGHTKGVRGVAFSPEGTIIASGSEDGTVRLWDCQNYKCFQILRHTQGVWAIVFADENRVITSGAEGLIKIWDCISGDILGTLEGHEGRVRSLSINHDKNILASGSEDLSVRLWDMETYRCIEILQDHHNWIRAVAISTDGRLVASGSEDQVIKIWNISEEKYVKTLTGAISFTKAITFSNDSKIVACTSHGNSIKLWDVDIISPLKVLRGHDSFVRTLAFNCDGQKIISGSDDGIIRIWDTNSGKQLRTIFAHTGWVNSIASNNQKNLFVSGGEDKIVRIWDIETGRCLKKLEEHIDGIRTVSFCFQGTKVASGSADRDVKIWNIEDGKCLMTLKGHEDWVISLAFSHSGRYLATGSSGKNIIIWDLELPTKVFELEEHEDWVYSLKFISEDKFLISSSRDGTIKTWDLKEGKCTKTLKTDCPLMLYSCLCVNGSLAAIGCENGLINILDIERGRIMKSIHDRNYEGMNIANVKGLTRSQVKHLKKQIAIN